MLASLFQLCGFQSVPFDEEFFISMLQGPRIQGVKHVYVVYLEGEPSSIKRPMAEEPPGPDGKERIQFVISVPR